MTDTLRKNTKQPSASSRTSQPATSNGPSFRPVPAPFRPSKRTLHDYFGGKAPEQGLGQAPGKRPKKKEVSPLDTLSLSTSILIAPGKGGGGQGSPVRLLTRQQYVDRGGLEQRRAGHFPVTQSELNRLGYLSLDNNRCYQVTGTIAEKLKGRDLIIRDTDGQYWAVEPKTHGTLKDIRTLDEARNRFGVQHVWFWTGKEFSSPEAWEKSGRYRSAAEKFAAIIGRVHERSGSNLPEAIYRLPNGDYADRNNFDMQWRTETDSSRRPAERPEDSVLFRAVGGKGFVTPSTLKWLSSNLGDEDYYTLKMKGLRLDEKRALNRRDPAPALLAGCRFDTNIFIASDRLAKMAPEDCHGLVDEDRTLLQNRNQSGRRTGNFSSFTHYKLYAKPVDAEQAGILRQVGFLDFTESVSHEKTTTAVHNADVAVKAAPVKALSPSSASDARGEIANRMRHSSTRGTF